MLIKLTKEQVPEFVAITSQYKEDINIRDIDRHNVVDGKSLLGIMNLDLSKPLVVNAYGDAVTDFHLINDLKQYLFEEIK